MATIVDGDRKIPFLRGMLAHYLIEQGFSFQEAYQVADGVRSAVQKQKNVSAKKMVDLVHTQVRELYGPRPMGDGIFWSPRSKQIMVEAEGGTRPFSREHLSQSLTTTGLAEEPAYGIAERIVADFIQQGKTVVKRSDIRKAASGLLGRDYGEDFAERYRIWNWFRNQDQPQPIIILIGGATGVGKTSVAVALANLLRVSRVASTDEIRQVMRLMIAPDLMPALHASSYEAWKDVGIPPPGDLDPVLHAFREQSGRVCVGVRATIDRAIQENVSLVLDGIHLLPDLLGLDAYKKDALFLWTNLFLSDTQAYGERFKTRGQTASQRPQHRYLKHLDQILKLQDYILDVGKAHGVSAFENVDLDDTLQSLSLHIMDSLRVEAKRLRPDRK